jgi:transcription initiation factor TFIIIB Brf1 subunit/transcription initiation factor TFIIB
LAITYQLTREEHYAAKQYVTKLHDSNFKAIAYDITATALIYLVRKQSRRPVGLRTVAAKAGIPFAKIGKEYLRLVQVVHPNIPEDSWDPAIDLPELSAKIYNYLGPVRNKVPSFSFEALLKLAGRILDIAASASYNTGRSGNSFVVACIVLASDVLTNLRLVGHCRKERLNDIGKLTLSTGQSIEKRYAELGKLFRQKADKLPWIISGSKCRDIVPILLDILEFEESIQDQITTAKVEEINDSQQANIDSNYEDNSSELSREQPNASSSATATSVPPSFLRAEIARKKTMANLELAKIHDETLDHNEEDQEVLQMIFLRNNGVNDEEICLMSKLQRNVLEDSLRFRKDYSVSQPQDLDNPHLDEEDLSAQEQRMYIRAPVSRQYMNWIGAMNK